MSKQFQFKFSHDSSYLDSDFIVSLSNLAAFTMINNWPNWVNSRYSRILYLFGPKYCGKTHLARIWQHKANAKVLIPSDDIKIQLDHNDSFLFEDLEKFLDQEEQILHIFNMIDEMGKCLIFTSTQHPAILNIKLADLKSRLLAISSVEIFAADDKLLETMLIKLFSERHLRINHKIINYILNNCNRSFADITHLVALIDKKAYEQKKNVSIKMVKEILGGHKNTAS